MAVRSIITQEMTSRYYSLGLWGRGTFLDHLHQHSHARPNDVSIWDREKDYTFSDILIGVEALSMNLAKRGMGRGSRVAIQVPNWYEFFLLHFALEKIGGIIVPLTPNLRTKELQYILNKTECTAFVCPRSYRSIDYIGMAESLKSKCPCLSHIFIIEEGERGRSLQPEDHLRDHSPPKNFYLHGKRVCRGCLQSSRGIETHV